MSESTISLYNCKASKYESEWEEYLEHTHDVFLKHIETDENDLILDISAGTGLLAHKLVEQEYPFRKIIVNDPSENMLAIARERLSKSSKVRFSSYKAEECTFPDTHFNRIFCLNAFHFYSNQRAVLKKIRSLLPSHGKLYILDWNRAGFFRLVNQLIQWRTSEFINTRSMDELQKMLADNDFLIRKSQSWNWRYWKFLFIEAEKIG